MRSVSLIALAVQLRDRRHLSLQSTAVAELLATTAISLTFDVANVECIYPRTRAEKGSDDIEAVHILGFFYPVARYSHGLGGAGIKPPLL